MVGDVRGRGLMIGVEIVKDKKTKAIAHDERDRIVELAFERGLLFLGAGENSIRNCAAPNRDSGTSRHRDGRAGRVHRDGGEIGLKSRP